MKKQLMILLALPLLAAACTGSSNQQAEPATPATANDTTVQANDIQSAQVDGVSGATNVANAPSFNGIIIMPPQNHVTLTLNMGGTVQAVNVLPGDHVRKGQVILTLANPAFIELQQAYLDAAAQTEYLEKEYQRQQNLASSESASQKRLQQSKADYLSMKSRKEAAAAQLQLLDIDTDQLAREGIRAYLDIRTPRSGYVTNMDINTGKYYAAGEPVCDVIDKSAPMLQLTAYEKDLTRIGRPNGGQHQPLHQGICTHCTSAQRFSSGNVRNSKDYRQKTVTLPHEAVSSTQKTLFHAECHCHHRGVPHAPA